MMDTRKWIEENKDHLVCEPSGRSYDQMMKDRIRKIMIVEHDIDNIEKEGKKE